MNCLLGETSIDMQVDYLGTRLTGKAQEWFYRNVEQFDHTSDYMLAAILSAYDMQGALHPIMFHSHTFTSPELNYDMHDKSYPQL